MALHTSDVFLQPSHPSVPQIRFLSYFSFAIQEKTPLASVLNVGTFSSSTAFTPVTVRKTVGRRNEKL